MSIEHSNLSCVVFILTAAMTYAVSVAARRFNLLAEPGTQSSHTVPTPTIGGLGFVVPVSLALVWLYAGDGGLQWRELALVLMSCVLATVGFWDDIRPVRVRFRLGLQGVVCLLLLAVVGDDLIDKAFGPVSMVIALCLFLAAVWWVNLFNFMDGIDGLAGSQCVFIMFAGALLAAWQVPESTEAVWWLGAIMLAVATCGFLISNWAPAKIFMGDGGSTYLGFMTFFFAQAFVQSEYLEWSTWLILAAGFVTDATVTLGYRVSRGACLYHPHREHAYQILARRFGSHESMTMLSIAINLFFLLPLAVASVWAPQRALYWLVAAYLPLTLGVCFVKSILVGSDSENDCYDPLKRAA